MTRRLVLVDLSGYIYQAHHVVAPIRRPSDGLHCGTIRSICTTLWKLQRSKNPPSHIACVFDAGGRTFRNDIYEDYKAHRPPAPPELAVQQPYLREAAKAFNIAGVELQNYEADDLIGTYARLAVEQGMEVVITSGDKDMMQLVRDGVRIFNPFKWKMIDRDDVFEKFGVEPEQVVDSLALQGDASDNIPGVPGIGVKIAAELLSRFGTLDELLSRTDEIRQPKRRQVLEEFADKARLSRELARIKDDVPVEAPIEALEARPIDPTQLLDFLDEMEFRTLSDEFRASL